MPAAQSIAAPDLSQAEPKVREQIESSQHVLEERLAEPESTAGERAEAYGQLGMVYVTYTFFEAAEACFLNAQSLKPNDPRWPYLLGYLYQTQGFLEKAVDTLTRSLELRPGDPPSQIRLATTRVELGQNDSARELFQEILEANPDSAAALNGLGRIAAAEDDTASAIDYFERALALQPSANSLHHSLGLAYRQAGDLDRARRELALGGDGPVLFEDPLLQPVTELGESAELYLVRAAQAFDEGRFEVAATYYRQGVALDPHNFTSRKAFAYCLEKLGDLEGAIEQLRLAMQQGDAGDEERNQRERAEVLRVLASVLVLHGRENEALETFQEAFQLNPDQPLIRMNLGNALARAGRLEEALKHFDVLLEEHPDNSSLLLSRGTALMNLDRREEALRDFERAVKVAPDNPEVRLRYAEALEFLGRNDQAAAVRSSAARLGSDDAQRVRLAAESGHRAMTEGRYDDAIRELRRALELDPEHLGARFELASVLAHLGQLEPALEEISKVIAAAPSHAQARRTQAIALLLSHRWVEARDRLSEGLEVIPRERQLAHALARILASAPVDRARNGALALEMARRVYAVTPTATTAETLAMAFAESGEFTQALELQRSLLAKTPSNSPHRPRLEKELQAYEKAQAWRAETPDETIQATLLTSP